MIRASDLVDGLGESNNPQWKTVAVNTAGELVVPNGSIGFRWGEKGKWNLESIAAGTETELSLTLLGQHDSVGGVAFPYFGGIENPHFRSVKHDPVLVRQLPVKNLTLADGSTCPVVSVLVKTPSTSTPLARSAAAVSSARHSGRSPMRPMPLSTAI